MFAALALAKMDCGDLANYFLLPALFGVVYLNQSNYQKLVRETSDEPKDSGQSTGLNQTDAMERAPVIGDSSDLVDSVESALALGLGAMILLQLASNFLGRRSSRVVRL